MTMQQINEGETRSDDIDFSALLGSGDSLDSVTGVVEDPTGDLTIGSPSIVGDTIVFTVLGTVVGKRYRLAGTVVTANGETLVEYATIAGL